MSCRQQPLGDAVHGKRTAVDGGEWRLIAYLQDFHFAYC